MVSNYEPTSILLNLGETDAQQTYEISWWSKHFVVENNLDFTKTF